MSRYACSLKRNWQLQVNVRELVCCSEPDKFGSVRASPDFKVHIVATAFKGFCHMHIMTWLCCKAAL